jgi:cytochrome c biogenesis DsbD-like protein
MRHLVFAALIAFVGTQSSIRTPSAVDTPHLTVTTSVENRTGTHATLVAEISPKPKMHVYAPGQERYIPIVLKVDSTPLFTSAAPKYPPPEKLLLPAINDMALVYTKPVRITEEIALTADVRKLQESGGVLTVKGSLKYQACDETICYLPKTVSLEWRVPISAVQTTDTHASGHEVVGALGARQLAVKEFTTLPKGTLFLRVENFATAGAAEHAATAASAVFQWAGKVWLLTLGPRGGRPGEGTVVAEIGPVPPVPHAAKYVLDVNEAEFGPESKAAVGRAVHTHPGPEIFYLLTGEQCLETPNGVVRARAGEGMTAPANTPMQLNIMGASKRDAFFVIVHDATKARVIPSDWQPTGLCDKAPQL